MKYLLSLFVFLAFGTLAQEECELPDNDKVKKLYEKALDRKKTKDADKRFQYMLEAVEEDDACVPCYWELAKTTYTRARMDGSSYTKTKDYYERIVNLCPNYQADVYYYLGLMNFQEGNSKEAEKYFTQFVEFKDKDEDKFSNNHFEKVKAAKAALPELNFKNTFFNNPVPFSPVLVDNVSTKGEEYLPMISADDESIFFTRVYDSKGLGDIVTTRIEELVIAKRDNPMAKFDKGVALPKPFNTGQNYGGVSISVNNKELYLCACEMVNGYNNCDIFVSNYEYQQDEKSGKYFYKWSEMKNLGANINSNTTWEAQPSISADGKTLYFATSRPSTKGIDIYYSQRDENGEWGRAKTLGSVINSDGNDKAPFLHTDSKTLYFASEIAGNRRGAGDYDIFFSKQNEKGEWSEPKNLGYPINSERAEDGLIVNITGQTAYFSSGRMSGGVGGRDIYSFELPEEAKPEKVILMTGKLKDDGDNPVTSAKLKISYQDESKNQEIAISSDDGKFAVAINMENEDQVIVTLKEEGKGFQSRLVKAEEAKGGVIKNKDIEVKEMTKGSAFVINDIQFATNSAELDKNAQLILSNFAQYLMDNNTISFRIVGHTDDVGDNGFNLKLSADRAESVKDYLISKGVKSTRISSEGKGETQPKVKNTSEINRQINRRTEFQIIDF